MNDLKENRLGNLNGFTGGSFAGQVYDIDGLAPSITTMGGGGRQPHIIIDDLYKNRDIRVYEEYAPSLRSERTGLKVVEENNNISKEELIERYKIRKLTPKECWRLMNIDDESFERAEEVNSNTQLYKESGNAIVVNCIVAAMGQLFNGKENVYKEISIL